MSVSHQSPILRSEVWLHFLFPISNTCNRLFISHNCTLFEQNYVHIIIIENYLPVFATLQTTYLSLYLYYQLPYLARMPSIESPIIFVIAHPVRWPIGETIIFIDVIPVLFSLLSTCAGIYWSGYFSRFKHGWCPLAHGRTLHSLLRFHHSIWHNCMLFELTITKRYWNTTAAPLDVFPYISRHDAIAMVPLFLAILNLPWVFN